MMNLGTAFADFFRDCKKPRKQRKFRYPKFKKKRLNESFELWADQFDLDWDRVRIPKLGWVRMRENVRLCGVIMAKPAKTCQILSLFSTLQAQDRVGGSGEASISEWPWTKDRRNPSVAHRINGPAGRTKTPGAAIDAVNLACWSSRFRKQTILWRVGVVITEDDRKEAFGRGEHALGNVRFIRR